MSTKLLSQNKKMSKSTNDKYLVYNFGIPAYKSASGLKTCPMAGKCKDGCYARTGFYRMGTVSRAYEYRLKMSQSVFFVTLMQKELDKATIKAKKQQKQLVIRIHDSGDFYSLDYFWRWVEIMENNPNTQFYAYTKMVPMFKNFLKYFQFPDNFRLIYSFGGKADHLIDITTDFHSQVFPNKSELLQLGYQDASQDDLVAALGDNNKIGLIYHGAKSKIWTTNNTKKKSA